MARIRTIKPEFWDSPSTARATLRARLFFIAMWNWADDYGVGTANAKALIGFAFPNDDDVTAADFPTLRKEVADCFGVVFYEDNGRPFYAIPSWDKHQKTERKAKRANPAPPQETSASGFSEDTQGTSDAVLGSSGTGTGEQGNRGNRNLAPGKPARERDELFDALVAACGIDAKALTASARGNVNAALKQLREVEATPVQVQLRARRFQERYRDITLTPSALAKHWPSLNGSEPRGRTEW